jgi:hypothetical protein
MHDYPAELNHPHEHPNLNKKQREDEAKQQNKKTNSSHRHPRFVVCLQTTDA